MPPSIPEPRANPAPTPGLYGVNPAAVIEVLRQRALRKTRGPAGDGRKLALVLEGGAMRAAAPAGGALALAHLGLVDAFDAIYATSAGAINASYYLSGQGDLGISIYFEDLTTGWFINPRRFWKMVDVDHLFDEVVTRKKALDVARVLASSTRFFATVMDIETGRASMIDTQATATPLLSVIKAAMALPVLYNRTVEVEGRPCLDGGLHIPFPLQQAIDHGCTDILLLLSRGHDYISPEPSWWSRWIFDAICARGRRGISETYARHHLYSRAARDLALGRATAGLPPGVNIAAVCTEDTEPLQRTTVDPIALRAAAVSYGRRTLRVLGVEAGDWALGPANALDWSAAQPGRQI
jgi:predicted patatin/cPLA2 family phospholipase